MSASGFWLLVRRRELFVSFKHFPWFEEVPLKQLFHVRLPNEGHLHWPDLDVDLEIESIEHPERFPLVSKVRPNIAVRPPAGRNGRRLALGDATARRRCAQRSAGKKERG